MSVVVPVGEARKFPRLSDLDDELGETVNEFFTQDTMDDGRRVDPVFIGGPPEMK